jgi:hypothetical protein
VKIIPHAPQGTLIVFCRILRGTLDASLKDAILTQQF